MLHLCMNNVKYFFQCKASCTEEFIVGKFECIPFKCNTRTFTIHYVIKALSYNIYMLYCYIILNNNVLYVNIILSHSISYVLHHIIFHKHYFIRPKYTSQWYKVYTYHIQYYYRYKTI